MNQLVLLDDYPEAKEILKKLFQDTMEGTKNPNRDFKLLADDDIVIIALMNDYPVFVPPALITVLTTDASPDFDFFRSLPSVYSLTDEELKMYFITYASSTEWLNLLPAVALPSVPPPPSATAKSIDYRPGVGVGTMTDRWLGALRRTREYKTSTHVPSVIEEMTAQGAEVTHLGMLMVIQLPTEIPPRIAIRGF